MRRSLSALLAGALLAGTALAASPLPAQAEETAKDPVIIVSGLTATAPFYNTLAARLTADGYTVSIFELPFTGLVDINYSAAALAQKVAAVRAQTGAAEVDLIGHSMGGLASLDFVKKLGGASSVDDVVTLGTPFYGTTVVNRRNGETCQGAVGCLQLAVGSEYLRTLMHGEAVPAGVDLTAFVTQQDELVQPYVNSAIRPLPDSTSVVIQDQCPGNTVSHVLLPHSGVVYSGIVDALADQPVTLDCAAV